MTSRISSIGIAARRTARGRPTTTSSATEAFTTSCPVCGRSSNPQNDSCRQPQVLEADRGSSGNQASRVRSAQRRRHRPLHRPRTRRSTGGGSDVLGAQSAGTAQLGRGRAHLAEAVVAERQRLAPRRSQVSKAGLGGRRRGRPATGAWPVRRPAGPPDGARPVRSCPTRGTVGTRSPGGGAGRRGRRPTTTPATRTETPAHVSSPRRAHRSDHPHVVARPEATRGTPAAGTSASASTRSGASASAPGARSVARRWALHSAPIDAGREDQRGVAGRDRGEHVDGGRSSPPGCSSPKRGVDRAAEEDLLGARRWPAW